MSDQLDNNQQKIEKLTQYCTLLIAGESGKELYNQYRSDIETVTPFEAMDIFDRLLKTGTAFAQVKNNAGKIINVFYKSLSHYQWEKPNKEHFISLMMRENEAAKSIMNQIKAATKSIFLAPVLPQSEAAANLSSLLHELSKYEKHYIKKENILFPYIEKTYPGHGCLHIMWSFHDDFRHSIKTLLQLLSQPDIPLDVLSNELGKLFFVVLPILFREEQIVFPVAMRSIPENVWNEMLIEAHQTGWCYIDELSEISQNQEITPVFLTESMADLGTGLLSLEQIKLIFSYLPVDITFIDQNNEVRFFSEGGKRIFHRSKAIIGRKVQNCHPPESVHVVDEIINAFRNGSESHADFWIEMKGRFIYIRYFALRNAANQYMGTIEVTQDATEIRELSGQRRILNWNQNI